MVMEKFEDCNANLHKYEFIYVKNGYILPNSEDITDDKVIEYVSIKDAINSTPETEIFVWKMIKKFTQTKNYLEYLYQFPHKPATFIPKTSFNYEWNIEISTNKLFKTINLLRNELKKIGVDFISPYDGTCDLLYKHIGNFDDYACENINKYYDKKDVTSKKVVYFAEYDLINNISDDKLHLHYIIENGDYNRYDKQLVNTIKMIIKKVFNTNNIEEDAFYTNYFVVEIDKI